MIEMTTIAFKIGQRQEKHILRDSEAISNQYNDKQLLESFCADQWLSERDPVLLSFIQGLTRTALNSCSTNTKVAISRIVEQVYALRFQKLVAPVSFCYVVECICKNKQPCGNGTY